MFLRKGYHKQGIQVDVVKEAHLDEKLNEPGQQQVAQAVKQLANDDVSLAWRASLNAKIAAEAKVVKKKRQVAFVFRPAAGLALASALALVVMTNRPTTTTSSGFDTAAELEAQVLQEHLSAERSTELMGSPYVRTASTGNPQPYYDSADLETL